MFLEVRQKKKKNRIEIIFYILREIKYTRRKHFFFFSVHCRNLRFTDFSVYLFIAKRTIHYTVIKKKFRVFF